MTFLCICPQELTSLRRILKTWFGFGSVYMQCAGESMIKTHFEAYLIKAFCSSIGSTLELDSYKKMNKLNNCIWNNTSSQFPAALLNAMKYWFAFITSVTDSITTTFPSCKPGLFDPFLETRPKTINRMSMIPRYSVMKNKCSYFIGRAIWEQACHHGNCLNTSARLYYRLIKYQRWV